MKEIALNNGHNALVDDEDFEKLNMFKWYYNKPSKNGHMGYAKRRRKTSEERKEKLISMHRQIMNFPEGMEIDHINHNTIDNRRCNLRICTQKENKHNRKKSRKSKSGSQGVTWYKRLKKWRASIFLTIGYFDSKEEAARAYDDAAKKFFGEFACLNYPDDEEDVKE